MNKQLCPCAMVRRELSSLKVDHLVNKEIQVFRESENSKAAVPL
jgi:hypothetical protein